MENISQELLRQQYDTIPYPKIPIEQSPIDNYTSIANDNLITPYYLCHQKIIDTKDKVILDVGCGSGWTSLQLALANPEAKIVCIDLSKNSLEFAEKRLKYHGFENIEYYQIAMENITELNYEYDYINCEDVLYFTDNPVKSLQALKSVLKPKGIIRGNFHSYYQRFYHYLSQDLFRCLGLYEDNPQDFEIEVVAQTLQNLRSNVVLKKNTGNLFNQENIDLSKNEIKQYILMNNLIQNDKGYTIPQVFQILRDANLSFFSMVNWLQWNVIDLFKDKDKMPTVWEFVLNNSSEEEKLQLFELIHPIHRLIDFWCTHDDISSNTKLLSTWETNDWQRAKIHLHPQLKNQKVKEDLLESIKNKKSWEITKFIRLANINNYIEFDISRDLSSVLLTLWESPKTLEELVNHWLKIQSLNLDNLTEKTYLEAEAEIKELVKRLETFLYLLVEF